MPRTTPFLSQFPQRKSTVISERQNFHSTPQQTPFLISISSHLLNCASSQDFTGSLGFTNFRVSPILDYSTSRTPFKSHFINLILKQLPHLTQLHLTGKKTQQLDVGRSGINSEMEKGLCLVCDKSSTLATFWP